MRSRRVVSINGVHAFGAKATESERRELELDEWQWNGNGAVQEYMSTADGGKDGETVPE